ncbi:SIT4 phosphatase-associated protein [Nakaseomyces glabratus]|nr:SIT4 phosphatase-associated protein [Nakaseomyces glabratus]KAH7594982.1 SIT4 phosphatase-associated protein [Nakaseomyces glabratus]KAH7611065.1 SIT4 phosphatase-associated protein [Nakaseomyces glabratus]
MSGSFWKFGTDYSSESSLSRLLNKAFIKIEEDEKETDAYKGGALSLNKDLEKGNDEKESNTATNAETEDEPQDSSSKLEDSEESIEDDEEEGESLPTTEEEYKYYRPNMDVLDALLDDDELYTELMCSNFKLLVFLKYPEVLSKLIDYVKCNSLIEGLTLEELEERSNKDAQTSVEEEHYSAQVDREKRSTTPDIILTEADDITKQTNEVAKESESEKGEDSDSNSSSDADDVSVTVRQDYEEQDELRRARMAAEVLSADVWPISSAIIQNEDLLEKLWSIMQYPAPLPIEISTYFMKINERLLDMDLNGILAFILNHPNLLDIFLTHIDNPPLMDFLLKVISTDKADTPTGIIKILKEQGMIPKLLDFLSPEYDKSTQSAAGDFIKALVTISGNCNNEIASSIGPNELIRELVSPPMVEKLISIMLKAGSSLSNGVGIVIELIRKNNSDYDFVQLAYTTIKTHPPNDRDPIYLGYLLKAFAAHMAEFTQMLTSIELPPLQTPQGEIEPLGFERFKICELIAELLHCSNMTLLNDPNGESIVKERDEERERILKLENQKLNDESDNEIEDNNIPTTDLKSDTSQEDEKIANEMNDLQLDSEGNADDTDGSEQAKSDTVRDEFESKETNEEEYLENISDDSETEHKLRENPTVGDQLKIALEDTRVIEVILEMFFHYVWNNFLHNVVFDIIQQIFNGPLMTGYNRFLLIDLLKNIHMTDLIIKGNEQSGVYEEKHVLRLGYMGHLTLMAEEIVKFEAYLDEMKITFTTDTIPTCLSEAKWKYYAETELADLREKYNTILGDVGDEVDELEDEDDDDEQASSVTGFNQGAERDEDDADYVEEDDEAYENQMNMYDSLSSTHQMDEYDDEDDELYAEYNDIDNPRYYEYIDGDGKKTRLELNPADLHDGDVKTKDSALNNNEDENNVTNKFSAYMSDQLRKDFYDSEADEPSRKSHKPDTQQFDDNEGTSWESDSNAFILKNFSKTSQLASPEIENKNIFQHQFDLDNVSQIEQHDVEEDDDDYVDPNDDGQSYSKPNNPLYSDKQNGGYFSNSSRSRSSDEDENELSDDSEAELEGSPYEDQADETDFNTYTLCRSTSKDNLSWDENEQDRLMGMVSYNRDFKDS